MKIFRKERKIKWKYVYRCLRFLEVFVILIGVIFSAMQIKQVKEIQSAQFMLELNKELMNDKNTEIISAIENNEPIFKQSNGKFTEADIDKYLSVYELLNNIYCAHLISPVMLYNGFGYDIEKTYDNKEIQSYLNTIRKENKYLFLGFDGLSKAIKDANK